MKTAQLLLAVLLTCTPVQAAESSAPVPVQTPTPFFRGEGYPSWSQMTPANAVAATQAAIMESEQRLAAIAALQPAEYTLENTFLACYKADENLRQVQGYLYHLSNVVASPAWQQALGRMQSIIAMHKGSSHAAEQVWATLQAAAQAPFMEQLSDEQRLFVQRMLTDLRHRGLELPREKRAELAAIELELRQLGARFSSNIRTAANRWQLVITDSRALQGMPENWLKQAAAAASAQGHGTEHHPAWLITPATANDVVRCCGVEETRRRCWLGATSAGTALSGADNEPIIARTMELRHELATLLGYRHYADMMAADRMMGNAKRALTFIDDLLARSKPAWDAYVAEKLKRHSRLHGSQLTAIAPWNEAYVDAMLPPRQHGSHAAAITPYLPAEHVIRELMKLWGEVLGLRFEKLPTACLKPGVPCPDGTVETWHPSVQCYAVYDAATHRHLGSFYTDLYPRPGKRSQAWSMPLQFGEGDAPHLVALMANLSPPPADAARPHLLTHADLYLLAHEFGHVLHLLLAHPELRAQGAMGAERDFLEFPSHLVESWVWEPAALARLTRHYATGEPLPRHLAELLAADRRHSPIAPHMQLLCAAKLDLELNMHWQEKFRGRPLDIAASELLAPWQMPYTHPTPCAMRTMLHCMSEGYAAALYTYKWCEVMAADVHARFRQEGILNPATGAELRRTILEKGGSRPASDLFRDYMGRTPQPEALMKRYPPTNL